MSKTVILLISAILPFFVHSSNTACTKIQTVEGVPTAINHSELILKILRKLSFEVRKDLWHRDWFWEKDSIIYFRQCSHNSSNEKLKQKIE